ncbi:hypothetical protein Tco_0099175 [Tanacetum coccineum]
MAKLLLNKCIEKAQTESNLSITNTNNDMNIELSKEFLTELQSNAYHGIHHEDVVDHIAMVLKMLDLINIPGEGKIPTWEELVEKFFCKFYPKSYDREEEMLDEGNNWGIDPLEFISRVNPSFRNYMRVDGRTKKVLFHSWLYGSWNKRRMNDSILSSSDTTTDSILEPYLKTQEKNNTGKDDERRQMKRKCKDANLEANNTSNTLNNKRPNKRMCNAERFEAIKYSLGPNEEYISIRRCEYDTWERNDDTMTSLKEKEIDNVGGESTIWKF